MKRISSRSYLLGLRVHLVPILVWAATFVCVVMLFSRRSKRFQVMGIAEGRVQQIAATCTGRLTSISVELFDSVTQGQTLAVIDTVLDNERPEPELRAQLATLKAKVEHLVAESNSVRAAYIAQVDDSESEWYAESRPFATNVMEARFRVLDLKGAIERSRVDLKTVKLDIERFLIEGRLDVNDVAPYEFQRLALERDGLQKSIDQNQTLLDQAERDQKEAEARQVEFISNNRPYIATSEEAAQDVITKATKVLDRQMEEIVVQLEALELRKTLKLASPFNGVVNLIQRRAGETVMAGEPILTVAEERARQIVAYTTEEQAAKVQETMEVELVKRAGSVDRNEPQAARSQVTYVGPTIEQMPARLWRNPAIAQWGRPIVIEIPPAMEAKLVPGELVGIRLLDVPALARSRSTLR